MRHTCIIALVLLAAVTAYAEESGLIFYAPFDNFKVDAAFAKA